MDCLERKLLDPSEEPDLDWSLLKTITNNFSDDAKIGSGGFADVYKGVLQSGAIIAVKKLYNNHDMDDKKFIIEVGCLMKAKHKNIVRFLGYCSDTKGEIMRYEGKIIHAEKRHRLLCFEYLPKGSLDKYITDVSRGLEWRTRYKIIKGICEGLHYLHENSIVHLDLKPANILLNDDMVPKIADFGISRCFDEKQTRAATSNVYGTLGYMAPEFYNKEITITFKSDMYSLGNIILEMLTGRKGYPDDINNVLTSWSTRFGNIPGDPWLEHVKQCVEMGIKCIDHNPKKRPTTRLIMEMLADMERKCGFNKTHFCTSLEAHKRCNSIQLPTMDPGEMHFTSKVKMVSGHHPTVVYTIGEELSFTEFIMDLRGILADHPDSEDIFDGHHSSILSSTREHPVLAKQRAEQPARWIHVKLQAVDGEETLSTTLIMRDDNLYVCGFINQQGTVYELVENLDRSADMLPVDEYTPRRLSWGVGYRSLLDADTEDDLVGILACMNMGRDFAMDAVHVLSRFPAWVDNHICMNPRLALAGLIVMVCESARMNPIYDFFTSSSWSSSNEYFIQFTDRGSTEDLMRGYVLNGYGRMSRELLAWKSERYANPYPTRQLQDIYLVLNYGIRTRGTTGHGERSSMDQTSSRRGKKADDAKGGHGRPRVELLAIRADLGVVGMQTVTVFDGKRGHIIYRKEDQEKGQLTDDLVLTGPYTSISAYGCFAIIIEIPPPGAAAVGSSKGDGSGSIIWKWDCYDKKYAEEVDKGPITRTIRSSSGPDRDVVVTYAVMSNALEATVQVKMWRKDGNSSCSVHGKITATIGDFREEFILFRRTQETAQHFSSTESRVLQLTRNVVAVPCGEKLHIKLDLSIETSKNQGVSNSTYFHLFSFNSEEDIGSSQWGPERDHDGQFEVTVSWYPDSISASERSSRRMEIEMSWEPDISYIVGDDAEGFNRFVTELRTLVAEQPGCKDLMADHPELSSTSNNHPVLPKVRVIRERHRIYMEPAERLFRIKLEVVDVNKTSWITLVMRGDNLDVIGFINKDGVCYHHGDQELPRGYKPKFLHWEYEDEVEEVKLWGFGALGLGKDFVKRAVQDLWGYADVGPRDGAKRSLFGLKITICDSARMEPVREAIAAGWNKDGTAFEHLESCIRMWRPVSRALLDWKDHGYEGWTKLESMGTITSSEAARKTVALVLNDYDRICAC